MRVAWRLAVVLACLLAVPFGAPPHAEEAAVDAEAFELGLKRLYDYQKRKRFERGLEKLATLLKVHERKPWARGYRAALEDLAERLAFRAAFPPPKPADVVRGRIEKYDENKGHIRIRYDRESIEDWRRDPSGFLFFPARTRGPYLLDVYGKSYPYDTNRAPMAAIQGGPHPTTKRDQNWQVIYGTPPREVDETKVWLPATIIHFDGDTEKTASRVEVSPATLGKAYHLQLQVNETRIHAGINDKAAGRVTKDKRLWGWVGFKADNWTTAIFTGLIQPAWIQDRIDRVVQGQLATFRRTYSREDHLPAWLFENAREATQIEQESLPVEVEAKHAEAVRSFRKQVEHEDWPGAAGTVAQLTQAGAPAAVTAFLSATVHLHTRSLEQGLAEIERCVTVAPDFTEGRLLHGEVLRRLGRHDEALAAFRAAVASQEHDPLVYETAIHAMLGSGRPDAAALLVESAARTGVVSQDLDGLSRAVTKALQGPVWNRVYRYKSRNYEVFSNTGKATCIEASKLLEQALTAYKVNFHWVGRESERQYKVYLFGGKTGFMRYWQDLSHLFGSPPEHVAGVYLPPLKQLLIWAVGDREAMLETIRHEGFHQYLDRFMTDVPVWLNEGLAVYHQSGEMRAGKLRFGKADPDKLALLEKQGLAPLASYIHITPKAFYYGQRGFRNYAQAWALVHLLKEGKTKWRRLLKRVIAELQEEPAEVVLARNFPPETLRELETALRAHLAKLR